MDPYFSFTLALSASNPDILTFSTSDPANEGTKQLKYVLSSTESPSEFFEELDFEVQILMSTCDKAWRFPSDPEAFDAIYVVGSDAISLPFDGVDLTDCPFRLSLFNITDSSSPATAVNADILTLTQPVLATDPLDAYLVSVAEPGKIVIQTDDEF